MDIGSDVETCHKVLCRAGLALSIEFPYRAGAIHKGVITKTGFWCSRFLLEQFGWERLACFMSDC